MRSTNQIIIAAQDGQPATEEELRLALLATSYMLSSRSRLLRDLAEMVKQGQPTAKLKAAFVLGEQEYWFRGMKTPVDEYLGPDSIPGTPENQARRKASIGILKSLAKTDSKTVSPETKAMAAGLVADLETENP